MATIQNRHIDLDLDFIANPVTGDVPVKKDHEALKRSIRNIILTRKYERGFMPLFGADVDALLFEPKNILTAIAIKDVLESAILNYEPRIAFVQVQVQPKTEESGYDVILSFRPRGEQETVQFKTQL